MVRVFKIDAAIRNTFPKCVCGVTPLQTGRFLLKIRRLLPRIGKFIPKKSEGFFRRALGSYTHNFPKRGAASLTYLPHSRLDLPRSRLGLPRLPLSRNSGPVTEGFSNRGINFKDAYRISLASRHVFPFFINVTVLTTHLLNLNVLSSLTPVPPPGIT